MMDTRQDGTAIAAPAAPGIAVKRCAVYTRKSVSAGLEQEFNSLDNQRESGEHFVKSQASQGWRLLPDRYDDGGWTGANTERPAFKRLMTDIDAGKLDIVVVYKVDRLSRSLLDFAKMMDRFNKRNVAFVSVTQNFSTTDPIGRLTLNLLMSFAEFEREMIAARTRDKIAASRRRGMWTGGTVGLGYDVVNKHLVLNEHEAMVVREIFALYLEHRSLVGILRVLEERGRTTKRHESKTGRLRSAGEWTKDAVLRILKNPLYAGLIQSGDKLFPGEHQAIVDRATFDRVQAMLGERPEAATPMRNPNYFLRGLLRCASCGMAMTPSSNRKGGKEYRYYRCSTKDKRGADACPSKPMPAEALEDFVVKQLRGVTAGGKLAEDVARGLRARIASERTSLAGERRALPAAIGRLGAEGLRLAESMAGLTEAAQAVVKKRLDEVAGEGKRHELRLSEVERQLAGLANFEVEGAWVERALRDFDTLWSELTPENQGRLVRAVVDRVEVDGPGGRLTLDLASFVHVGATAGPGAGSGAEPQAVAADATVAAPSGASAGSEAAS